MSDNSILPPGIRVGAGTDVEERGVVRLDIGDVTRPPDGNDTAPVTVAVVITPRQARALGALLLKQADLVETAERARQPILRVLP